MSNIAQVIGWKFNHMPGMSTIDGVIYEFPAGVPGVNYGGDGLPTQADRDAWAVEYEADIAATQYMENRKAAMQELLPESMYLPAILEQAKADRDAGKTLCVELEEAVNIYMQILVENPEPS